MNWRTTLSATECQERRRPDAAGHEPKSRTRNSAAGAVYTRISRAKCKVDLMSSSCSSLLLSVYRRVLWALRLFYPCFLFFFFWFIYPCNKLRIFSFLLSEFFLFLLWVQMLFIWVIDCFFFRFFFYVSSKSSILINFFVSICVCLKEFFTTRFEIRLNIEKGNTGRAFS